MSSYSGSELAVLAEALGSKRVTDRKPPQRTTEHKPRSVAVRATPPEDPAELRRQVAVN
jgi:hypothetical protein